MNSVQNVAHVRCSKEFGGLIPLDTLSSVPWSLPIILILLIRVFVALFIVEQRGALTHPIPGSQQRPAIGGAELKIRRFSRRGFPSLLPKLRQAEQSTGLETSSGTVS